MTTLTVPRSLLLTGSPRERGRVHGEVLRPEITGGISRWKDALQQATGLPVDDYLDRFVAQTNFLPAIERWTPHLLDEVRGIGEGAGISFRDVYAYQLMDEEWLFRIDLKRGGAPLEHCSMVGFFGDGAPPILGQNMDLPKYYDGTQALLRVRDQNRDLESLIFTAAGLIGTTGLNNRGVGICCNTLTRLAHAYDGLPAAFIVRRVLESSTLAEASSFVREVSHASGQNYAIGCPDQIVDFECSAHEVVPFSCGPTHVYHTNHPLVNDDQPAPAGGAGVTKEPAGERSPMSNSEQRLAYLERMIGGQETPRTVDGVKTLLSTRAVPINVGRDSAGDGMTLGSLIMELTTPPVLHYAPGPPAETAYTRWTL
ncbi:MAG TPA: C45 family peptidase [Chloroflexota bacterium]|nr:C45 family peptidase [Chloroflexota bacterium]